MSEQIFDSPHEAEIAAQLQNEFLSGPSQATAASHLDLLFAEQELIAGSHTESHRSMISTVVGSAAAAALLVAAIGLPSSGPTVDLVAASPDRSTIAETRANDSQELERESDRDLPPGVSSAPVAGLLTAAPDDAPSVTTEPRVDTTEDPFVASAPQDGHGETHQADDEPVVNAQDPESQPPNEQPPVVGDDTVETPQNPPVIETRLDTFVLGGTELDGSPLDDAMCDGREATIVGSNGPDVIIGTDGPDVIVGGNGIDVIIGLGGDDIICGGNGDDEIHGGLGDDRIYGENGDDLIVDDAGINMIDPGRGPGTESSPAEKNPQKP